MSLSALIKLSNILGERDKARFNGRVPRSKKIVGYSKGYWLVEYGFPMQGGHTIESHWEQDARSLDHQQKYPNA